MTEAQHLPLIAADQLVQRLAVGARRIAEAEPLYLYFAAPSGGRVLVRELSGAGEGGLAETLAEIETIPDGQREPFCEELADFIDGLVSHYVLDNGKVVVAHAGMKESMQGRGSGKVREFALYGETTGETDEFGNPLYVLEVPCFGSVKDADGNYVFDPDGNHIHVDFDVAERASAGV